MGSIESYSTAGGKRYRARYRRPDHSQTDKRGFKTQKAAELFLASVEIEKAKGSWLDPSRSQIKISVWAEVWFDSLLDIKPSTREGYRRNLDKHIVPAWGTRKLSEVVHQEVQSWIAGLSSSLAPSTVNQVFFNFQSLFDFAITDGRIQNNPCKNIRRPKVRETSKTYLGHDQVLALAEACGTNADIILTLAYTGIRFGELAGLQVRNIDFANNRLVIDSTLSEISGVLRLGSPKNGSTRSVPFPAFLLSALKHRCQGKGLDEYVFQTELGRPLRNNNFRRDCFNPALEAVQRVDPTFPTINPHKLRNTAASLAISAGANVKSLQRMLGHSSAAMTLDVYADLFEDDLDSVGVALNNAAEKQIVGKLWAIPFFVVELKPAENEEIPAIAGIPGGGSDGRRSRDLTIFSRALYQLSYRAEAASRGGLVA